MGGSGIILSKALALVRRAVAKILRFQDANTCLASSDLQSAFSVEGFSDSISVHSNLADLSPSEKGKKREEKDDLTQRAFWEGKEMTS